MTGIRPLGVRCRLALLSMITILPPLTVIAYTQAPARDHLWLLFGVAIATLAVGIVATEAVGRRPVADLTRATERLAAGDFTARVALDRGVPGLDELAHRINEMAATLEARERERDEAEKQFRQAQKMEAVGRLSAGIAHDFKNILTVIIGNAELVASRLPEGHPLREEVDEIAKAGERGAALTQQLLAFSRRQVLVPRVLRTGAIVEDLVPMLRRLLGSTITLETATTDAWNVKADVNLLEQVIVNLAVNARDAMPSGGRLTIATDDVSLDHAFVARHPPMPPGAYVALKVTDTGIGMDRATQARAFQPFFTTKAEGGTGLGLSTVYGIVKQSEGFVWLESEVGRGTTFTIYFPRTLEPA